MSQTKILPIALATASFLILMTFYQIGGYWESWKFVSKSVSGTFKIPNASATHFLQHQSKTKKEDEMEFLERMRLRMNDRKARVRETCKRYDLQQNISTLWNRMLVDEKYKVIDYNMGKTGTTRFKEMFWQLKGYDLKYFSVGKFNNTFIGEKERQQFLFNPEWTKATVVREPFQRIVSAYRQKIQFPNAEFPSLSKAIHYKYSTIKDGKHATFNDFVNYLVAEAPKSIQSDNGHWSRYTYQATPCLIDYDFIGKQETIEEDAKYFLHLINAPKHIKHGPPYQQRSDEAMSLEYYSTVRPRELLLQLYSLLLTDYIMFDYPPPLALKLLFGNTSWQ